MKEKIPEELQIEISIAEMKIKVVLFVLNQKINFILFLSILSLVTSFFYFLKI